MTKPWKDVASSDAFRTLSGDEQDTARRQYFDQVVAPRVDADDQSAAWDQFATASGHGSRSLPEGIKPSAAGGGRGTAQLWLRAANDASTGPQDLTQPAGAMARSLGAGPVLKKSLLERTVEAQSPYDEERLNRESRRSIAPARSTLLTDNASAMPIKDDPQMAMGKSMADSNLLVRAGAKAVSGAAKGLGGTAQAIGDLAGIEPLARAGKATAEGAGAFEAGMGDGGKAKGFSPDSPVNYLGDMAEGAVSSLAQSVATAAGLGPRAVIPLMSVISGGEQYNKARAAGKSPGEALANAVPYGAFEAIGEKFSGLDRAMEGLKTLMKPGVTEAARRTAADALIHNGIHEVPGEVLTYLGQTGVDALPGIGINPNLTMDQFLAGLRDTVVQAGMMGGMTGGAGVVSRGPAVAVPPVDPSPSAPVSPEMSAPAIALPEQPTAESVSPGAPPVADVAPAAPEAVPLGPLQRAAAAASSTPVVPGPTGATTGAVPPAGATVAIPSLARPRSASSGNAAMDEVARIEAERDAQQQTADAEAAPPAAPAINPDVIGALNESAIDQAPIDEVGQPVPGEGGAQLPVPAAAAEQSGLAGGLAGSMLEQGAAVATDAPDQPARQLGAVAPAPAPAAPQVFPTYEEADTFRKEQKARGASIQALPVPTEGGFALAAKGSPGYAEGETLRDQRRAAKERADAGILDGDILNGKGFPFTIRLPANNAAKKAGPDHQVVPVKGGFVVRKVAPQPQGTVDEAVPSQQPATAPAAVPSSTPVGQESAGAGPAAAVGDAPAVRPRRDAAPRPPVAGGLAGPKIDAEWAAFSAESGTKGVPRADMPQIKAEHRGAMVNFLNARGIAHEQVEIPARELKPTQAEFSPARVEKAKAFTDGDRSILVSADGHVLDGHHQWLAKVDAGEPVKAIRLDAPIARLVEEVKQFPSAEASDGATAPTSPVAAAAPVAPTATDVPADGRRAQGAPAAEKASARPSARASRAGTRAPAAQKIEDFGETLTGARKMLYADAYRDSFAKAKGFDVAQHPLSKTWPEPDYQKLLDQGLSPWAAAFAHAARDAVPTKPQKGWKLAGWVKQVQLLRDLAERALTSNEAAQEVRAVVSSNEFASLKEGLEGAVDLYTALGHGTSLKGIRVSVGKYSTFEGVSFQPAKTMWTVERKGTGFGNWPTILSKGDTREQAISQFAEQAGKLLAAPEKKGTTFEIYSQRGVRDAGIFIGKKIGPDVAKLKTGFSSSKEAREWKAANQAELERLLADYKHVPPVRKAENAPRVGQDHRSNGDVSVDQFGDAFGFRGVQFGNYVEGKRRQADLNRAYDALMDLAAVLNVPPRSLSLNGQLGLAFGARGTGGKDAAAAHYEPSTVVINLTKNDGAGSLAHEWWHALDNYFARDAEGRTTGTGYMTEDATQGAARDKMRAAFVAIKRAILSTDLEARSKELDKRKGKPYWKTGREMAARSFESYVIAKLADQNASNDYLANVVPELSWVIDGGFPYPLASELPMLRAAFDNFFSVIEHRVDADGSVPLFKRAGSPSSISFQKWFGDSKVVEPDGQPMVMYHGTSQAGFESFDTYASNYGLMGMGGYFTADPAVASSYTTKGKGDSPGVYPVYLSIKNPIDMDAAADVAAWQKQFDGIEDFHEKGDTNEAWYRAAEDLLADQELPRWEGAEIMQESLRAMGFDGITHIGGGRVKADGVRHRVYVAFDPEQIKSATGNRGTYDPSSPDIRFSAGGPPAASGMPQTAVQQAIDSITAKWENAPQIVVARDMNDEAVPEAVRAHNAGQLSQGAEGAPKGFFYRGQVFVIADQMTSPQDVAEVVFHESLGHFGLRGAFGDGLKPILQQLAGLRRGAVAEKARQYGLDMNDEAQRLMAAEEVLAEMAQLHPELGFVQRAIAAIRSWLRTNVAALRDMELTDAEILRNYLLPARGWVERGAAAAATTPDVAFSRGASSRTPSASTAAAATTNPWESLEPTKIDRFIYEMQDGRVDLKRTQEAIAAAGNAIDERFDARLAETLYSGRVAKRTQTFLEREAQPLLRVMARMRVGQTELGDYLHARAAPERNAQIAKVNPQMPDGGAGANSKGLLLTTAAARQYIAAIPAPRRSQLEDLAKMVDAITRGTRQVLVDDGLEKAETIAAWEAAYKNYVPMFRDDIEFNRLTVHKRATGSEKQAVDILAHVLMQREAAITRAEKNRVGVALYGLALTNPNPAFWATIRPNMQAEQIAKDLASMGVDPLVAEAGMQGVPTIRTVDPVTNQVVDRINPMYRSLPGAITLKINGEVRVLMLNVDDPRAARMAESLKNMDGLTKLDIAGTIIGKTTRWLASVNTQYNPVFGIVNFVRDTMGGSIHVGNTVLRGKGTRVLAQVPSALIGIGRAIAGNTTSEWSKLYEQFQEDGGKTGYTDMFRDGGERARQIEKELSNLAKAGRLRPMRAAHAVLSLLEGFNTTTENAVRLAAYKTALDQGVSRPESARLARELTVDFNRKGRAGRELGPLYAFFNASLQGTERTMRALRGPTGGKIIAGGLALGVIQALMLAMAGFDDDELPEFAKARALIIPLPGKDSKEKRFISIPLPLGLHVLPNTGRVITELAIGDRKDMGKKLVDALGEIAGAFNPLGGGNVFTADGALRTVAPTIIDPMIELGFNRNFAGNPIERDSRGESDSRPGAARARESTLRSTTGQAYLGISKAINTLTGGSDFEQGALSPTPERLRYIAQTAGGGVLRELEKIINTSVDAARGEKTKIAGVPLASRFHGEVDGDQVQRSRYIATRNRLEKLEGGLRAAQKAGDGTAMLRMLNSTPDVAFIDMSNEVQKYVAELNKAAAATVNDRAQMKEIDAARVEAMRALNDAIRNMEAAAGKPTIAQRLRGAAKPEQAAAQ